MTRKLHPGVVVRIKRVFAARPRPAARLAKQRSSAPPQSLIWTPEMRMTEQAPKRRRRRHGRTRSRPEVMAACVRHIGDARALSGAAALRAAWGAWIDAAAPWVWFTTHTFREDVSPDRALRLHDRWLARLAEACRQKSRCSPELQSACAVEWTCRGRVHLHAVVSGQGVSDHRRVRWQHRWEGLDRVCGMARVFPARGRASAYLSKYCGKGGIVVVRGRFGGWPSPHDA